MSQNIEAGALKDVSAGALQASPPFPPEKLQQALRSLSFRWQTLPTYGTRTLAPLAMIWFSPLQLCVVLLIATLLWYPFRASVVSLRLAVLMAVLNNPLICAVGNIIVALAFFLAGAFADGIIALLWVFIANAISYACPPRKSPGIEERFRKRLRGSPSYPSNLNIALSPRSLPLGSEEHSTPA